MFKKKNILTPVGTAGQAWQIDRMELLRQRRIEAAKRIIMRVLYVAIIGVCLIDLFF